MKIVYPFFTEWEFIRVITMDAKAIIYFVDDDPDDHVIFADLVTRYFPGIVVYFFFGALELFRQLEAQRGTVPDAIILDYNMPMINGLECLHELKNNSPFATIPVIIYSTSGYSSAIELAEKGGAWKYAIKGDASETRQLIESILNLKKMRLKSAAM